MKQRNLTVLLAAMLLSGCQVMTGLYHGYPSAWSEISVNTLSTKGCPDISGKYVGKGICKYPSLCRSLLVADRLVPPAFPGVYGDTVTISHPDERTMEVTAQTAAGDQTTKRLSEAEGDFTCDAGAIWIKQGKVYESSAVGMASRKYSMGFQKAIDGSLVGKHRNSGWGLALWIIPVVGTQILWYKWAPLP